MEDPSYPTARVVAPWLHARFTEHTDAARHLSHRRVASVPDVQTIEAIISAAFWASVRREEGYVPRISLAYIGPEETVHPLRFERPLPLEPRALTRVAAAVEHAGIHLGVWQQPLVVWGTTRSIPSTCFVLEVAAPGLLVVKHHRW